MSDRRGVVVACADRLFAEVTVALVADAMLVTAPASMSACVMT